jgi:hypothetical protein
MSHAGFGYFFAFRFEATNMRGSGQGVDDIDGTGTTDRGALEAGGRAPGGCQGEAASGPHLQNDAVGVVLHTREVAVRWPLEAVDPGRPGPAALCQGCEDRNVRQPNAALGGTVTPQGDLACHASGPGVNLRPHLRGRLGGQLHRVLGYTGSREDTKKMA